MRTSRTGPACWIFSVKLIDARICWKLIVDYMYIQYSLVVSVTPFRSLTLAPFILGSCTDKKENQIFLIYKEIQSGAVVKSYK